MSVSDTVIKADPGLYLYDPFQEPENWAEEYGEEVFDGCCRGYEGIPPHEWVPANENIEPARISVTFFPDQSAQSQKVRSMTLPELGDLIRKTGAKSKAALPWLKLAAFGKQRTERNCLRHNVNVISITGVELDYDAKQLTFDQGIAIAKKARLQALLYTSARYTDAAPKWGIILPTSQPLPPDERAKLVARVNGLYGGIFDAASFTLSQSYYYGSVNNNPEHRVRVLTGDCIDRRDDLDAGAIGKNGAPLHEEGAKNPFEEYGNEQQYKKASPEKVKAALAIVVNDRPPNDPNHVNYNAWIEVGHEIKSWDASDKVGWRIYNEWGATWPGKMENGKLKTYNKTFARKRWNSFHPDHTNIGALFNRASRISPGWWEPSLTPIKTRLMQTSAEFVAGFVPPDYLIDGLLQRRYVYSMTAPTGSGKTAIALLIAAHVATGEPLAGQEVERGRVLFFAGENPDDVRARWIRLCEELGAYHDRPIEGLRYKGKSVDPDTMDVVFMPFTLNLSNEKIREQIDAEAEKHGPFSLLIVDTSASYYSGDDENDNVALGNHARMLRTFVELPGGPTILVTCHPTKTPNMDNLLPRGGGAFLAEVDGNLVCIKDAATMTVELTTHGKFRGPDFAPFSFKLVAGKSEKLVDSKGRSIWSIYAAPISNEDVEAIKQDGRSDEDDVLHAMLDQPGKSLLELAKILNWRNTHGEPNKQKVHRVMLKLKQAKLVEQDRDDCYLLKPKGKAEAERAPPESPAVKVAVKKPRAATTSENWALKYGNEPR